MHWVNEKGINEETRQGIYIYIYCNTDVRSRNHCCHGAVPWLRRLAAGLPPRRPRFDPGSVHMWDLWWTKWHWDRFFSEYFGFPLLISFHRCFITRKRIKIIIIIVIFITGLHK
jgi:hypothetical protein